MTPEEEEKILHGAPKGTFTLLLIFIILFTSGWVYMYLFMFLAHGPVH